MANELNQITVDSTGTSWVDSVPGVTSAGYQSQNTNITARTVGQDLSSVRVSGTDIIVDISGPIDIDGLPFSLTSPVTLTPSTGGVFYIQVVSGATSIQKSLELTSDVPVWDSQKNALYNGGNRVLNWVCVRYAFGCRAAGIINPQYGVRAPTCNYGLPRIIDISGILYQAYIRGFTSQGDSVQGLAFDGTNLISCDSGTDTIYIHDGISSTILSSFSSPGSNITGLAFDGTNLISCDSGTDTIYIHDGISSTILSSFSSPSSYPSDITFDGTNLISCDDTTDTIYIHDGISSTILSSFSSPSSNPIGLAFDGTNLISCDNNSDTIYIHDGISSTILSSFSSPSGTPSSLTFNGTNLISCDILAKTIYLHGII